MSTDSKKGANSYNVFVAGPGDASSVATGKYNVTVEAPVPAIKPKFVPWLLAKREFPFAFLLVFGFLTWTISHVTDRYLQLPIVKYTQDRNLAEQTILYTFTNITRDKNFRNLEIRIVQRAETDQIIAVAASAIGDGWSINPGLEEDGIILPFPNFHPGNEVQVKVSLGNNFEPRVQLFSSDIPTILETTSTRSFLVEHELKMLLGLGFLALCFVLWRLRVAHKNLED